MRNQFWFISAVHGCDTENLSKLSKELIFVNKKPFEKSRNSVGLA